jgi:hypothetical protein
MTETRRSHATKTRAAYRPMGRRSICAALILASLTLAANASAAPTATLKVKAIPIPGFPGTGNILGAGTAVEAEVTISGTEYGGFPSPLTGINIYTPAGLGVNPEGFASCAPSVLEARGPAGCPKRSSAGPPGVGLGVVSFGGERVPESVSIQEFFSPTGSLTFYVEGNTPASFELLEPSHWIAAGAPFGHELVVEVPLVETAPGADDASVISFKAKVGTAYKRGKKTVSYLTQPKKCPKGGFPVKMELKFMSGEITTVSYKTPCPKR